MTKKQAPAVTLEQLETEIQEHHEASENLTYVRDELLNREKRERLESLQAQLEEAVRGKDGAREKRLKAKQDVDKALQKLADAQQKEQQAARDLSIAELAVRQVRHEIDTLERHLQSE